MVKVYKDKISVYLKYDDRKVRPLANSSANGFTKDAFWDNYRVILDNTSALKEGDRVYKSHIAQTTYFKVRDSDRGTFELWFIHED